MSLSVGAEVLLIVAAGITLFSHTRVWGVAILPLIWPAYYAVLYGIAFGIATIDQRGPFTANFPKWYQGLYPPIARQFFDAMYPRLVPVALLSFPLGALLLSVLVLWTTATGQNHP